MRKDVEFKSQDGVTLAAWHYLPDQHSGKVPMIVMAHGFSAVKEMYLDRFAEVFAEAGLGALVLACCIYEYTPSKDRLVHLPAGFGCRGRTSNGDQFNR
jgi:hypothetical protein